ncbi:MAG: hypothetical protein RLZZ385_2436 [Pseudomonadota bacterium]
MHLWNPPYCGEMDMRIAADGTWYHEGAPLRRPAMVKLFSNILKREGERYFLVTPVEKVGIQVDDCPFVTVALDAEGSGNDQRLVFTLNTGEQVTLTGDHGLQVETRTNGEPHPVLEVRNGLHALVSRKDFYRLVGLAESGPEPGSPRLGVWSNGGFFPLDDEPGLG